MRARAVVLHALRTWFAEHGYLEVPTPVRVHSPAMEENLFAFPSGERWLRTSPEFALKRVIASGLPRIYEIGPCFRAREQGAWHHPEFTMLEWYRVGCGLSDLMTEVQELVATCAGALHVDAPAVWRHITIDTLFREVTGNPPPPDDEQFFRVWAERIDPALPGMGALFVTEWPESQAALAQVHHGVAQRFEAFIDGVELANAFLELIDGDEQRRRFAEANAKRASAGESPHAVDDAFIDAVSVMPMTSGIALGVDRLVAVLMEWDHIAPGIVG